MFKIFYMIKTVSYVWIRSDQISDSKENLFSNKTFLFFKKSNFKGEKEKRKD